MNIDWTPQPDWRPRLLRICERLHRRQPAVRAFLVAGDYAHGVQAADSVLTCIAFFPDWRPDYTLGAVQALDGLPVALDWPTTAFLVEIEPALQDDVRAHRLATAQPLLSYDQTLDGVLRDFRDRYFAPDERAARVRRLCDRAAALIDRGAVARPDPEAEAWEAFVFGIGPALCHLVDEPPARRRLLPRFRAAARVRRMLSLAGEVAAAFALPERDAAEALRHAQDLRDLAEAHIRATHARRGEWAAAGLGQRDREGADARWRCCRMTPRRRRSRPSSRASWSIRRRRRFRRASGGRPATGSARRSCTAAVTSPCCGTSCTRCARPASDAGRR